MSNYKTGPLVGLFDPTTNAPVGFIGLDGKEYFTATSAAFGFPGNVAITGGSINSVLFTQEAADNGEPLAASGKFLPAGVSCTSRSCGVSSNSEPRTPRAGAFRRVPTESAGRSPIRPRDLRVPRSP